MQNNWCCGCSDANGDDESANGDKGDVTDDSSDHSDCLDDSDYKQ